MMDRRKFLKLSAASGSLAAAGASGLLAACGSGSAMQGPTDRVSNGRFNRAPGVSPENLTLTARQANVEIAPGVHSRILTWGDGPIGPTIEARTGQRATIALPQPRARRQWHDDELCD